MNHEVYIGYSGLDKLYPFIFEWLTTITLGGHARKSTYQYYNKNLWLPIRKIFYNVRQLENKTLLDEEFLSCCHIGKVYRVQNYNERLKGYIYLSGCYQSWTTEEGLESLSRIGGKVLLVCGTTNENTIAINTFKLLCFIFRNIEVKIPNERYHPKFLCRYEGEYEIVLPMIEELIDKLIVVDSKKIKDWESQGTEIPYSKWFRKQIR